MASQQYAIPSMAALSREVRKCIACPAICRYGDQRRIDEVKSAISYENKRIPVGEANVNNALRKIIPAMVGRTNY